LKNIKSDQNCGTFVSNVVNPVNGKYHKAKHQLHISRSIIRAIILPEHHIIT